MTFSHLASYTICKGRGGICPTKSWLNLGFGARLLARDLLCGAQCIVPY